MKEIAAKNRVNYETLLDTVSLNLTTLINHWLRNKNIPAIHNTARLIFIYKNKRDVVQGNAIDSFRPISITSIFFKLIEHLLKRRIDRQLEAGSTNEIN